MWGQPPRLSSKGEAEPRVGTDAFVRPATLSAAKGSVHSAHSQLSRRAADVHASSESSWLSAAMRRAQRSSLRSRSIPTLGSNLSYFDHGNPSGSQPATPLHL